MNGADGNPSSEQIQEKRRVFHFPGGAAIRLDKYLVANLPEYSRSRLQAWIKDGRVTVNGQPVLKSGQSLEEPAEIWVDIPPPVPSSLVPEPIPLDIVFENENMLVVNKAVGMVVHPSAGHASGTLVHAVLAHAPQIEGVGGTRRPGVVHRLDKNTSGLILVAKNDVTHRALQEQFRSRTVEKTYLALVDGSPPTPAGRVEAAIGRDSTHRQRMAVQPPGKGRPAVTEYHTRRSWPRHTFLEVHPHTGRTHQIRVHLAFLGCPVVGDRVYGLRTPSLDLEGHFLHAARLRVSLPGEQQPRTFSAALPQALERLLERL